MHGFPTGTRVKMAVWAIKISNVWEKQSKFFLSFKKWTQIALICGKHKKTCKVQFFPNFFLKGIGKAHQTKKCVQPNL